MKQFQVEIVNVGAPVKTTTARGGYNTMEVAYKQDGKVTGKKFIDVYTQPVYGQLQAAKPGDVFLVNSEKDEKGYYKWVSIEQVTAQTTGSTDTQQGSAAETSTAASGQRASGRVTGSNYETPEERATKQAIIVRQFALNAAIEYCKAVPVTLEVIKTTARQLEDFVYTDIEGRIASIRAAVKQA